MNMTPRKVPSVAPAVSELGFSRSNPGSERTPYELREILSGERYLVLEVPTLNLVEISADEWLSPLDLNSIIVSESHNMTREQLKACGDALRRCITWHQGRSMRESALPEAHPAPPRHSGESISPLAFPANPRGASRPGPVHDDPNGQAGTDAVRPAASAKISRTKSLVIAFVQKPSQ